MTWLLLNPDLPLSACAVHFGVGQPWLSTLIHSDCFQARLREQQERLFSGVTAEIKEKLTAAAHLSLDRVMERLAVTADEGFILNANDKILKNLGYGAPRVGPQPGPTINNIIVNGPIDREQLARARAQIDKSPGEVIPLILEHKAEQAA
jgi:hypothetical protein